MDDPFFVWATPDETARRGVLRAMFSLAVEAAAARGFLWMDERGVVVLLPPGRKLYGEEQAAKIQAITRNAFQSPLVLLDDYKRRLHAGDPGGTDSWYLQYLTVPAAGRSRGAGGSLMKDIVLARLDGAPLWLHTGRRTNLSFYAKFELQTIATTWCEPGGPYVHTLRRSPRMPRL
ncbi:hypothetical protein [Streptosporangium lutulentum]|uniref:N-acetyltransferase domain-containing protein n=1 Tax=Streptosporangium lutulentum TaxID=1461250 RepID=A0ABT9QF72_9ACTN|nr:hypothetical protein [Streptosporangium lutulentum]MDP9845408.1 hypothetical protein [Streptosporangium lutulentum]